MATRITTTTRPLAATQSPDLATAPIKGTVDFADLAHASSIDDSQQVLVSPIRDVSVDDAHVADGGLDLDDTQVDDHTGS